MVARKPRGERDKNDQKLAERDRSDLDQHTVQLPVSLNEREVGGGKRPVLLERRHPGHLSGLSEYLAHPFYADFNSDSSGHC